eukprot:SAG22_NODE_12464_length_442_cov_0.746356_1_plen_93_part_10
MAAPSSINAPLVPQDAAHDEAVPVSRAAQVLAQSPCTSLAVVAAVSIFFAATGHLVHGGPAAAAETDGFNPRGTVIGDRDNTLQLITNCDGGG